ncbi:hypothetical protein ACFQL1_02855 [Halomicroarcula sp. GCM10025709]|uniref:DUF7115 domain-containing protein n=1 Tax=Haloarcula TaxID=2237 RepID=UPI0024C2422E|nr:hypothetical protein [Halomicroarcula sp. YJ-61-S]
MEIPDLVRGELGDEEVQAGVALGDEDMVCFTPSRTLVYRGEGLLSDEGVEVFPHEFERLSVSEGRRKATFSLAYVDTKRELSVPVKRSDAVLEQLLESSLRATGVLDEGETVAGVFRFSELTLVVTSEQLLKHVGSVTWDGDFEQFAFGDVTGLEFEEGSVATAIVLSVDGRPERIKAPSDKAPSLRRTLQQALFAYHDVSSLEALNDAVGDDEEPAPDASGLGLDAGIDPLVSDDDDSEQEPEGPTADTDDGWETAEPDLGSGPAVDGDLAALESQVEELTELVEQQNEQLQRQEKVIKQLIAELRQGR